MAFAWFLLSQDAMCEEAPCCEEAQATGQTRGRFISPKSQLRSQSTTITDSHMSEHLVDSSPRL